MSIFTDILAKTGVTQKMDAAIKNAQSTMAKPAEPTTLKTMPAVDVMAILEKRAAAKKEKLNWKESIVDLMKLIEIDSSFKTRKELAVELKCPADLMNDSARMNVWLHKTVLQKISENGGNIPKNLLD